MRESTLGSASLVKIPQICDPRGNLSFIENVTHLPFDIARVEWLAAPSGAVELSSSRYKAVMVVALAGEVAVGGFTLSNPAQGLILDLQAADLPDILLSPDAVALMLYGSRQAAEQPPIPAPNPAESHRLSTVDHCRWIELPQEAHGAVWLDNSANAPYPVRRVFYVYQIPGGASRGGHSHHQELCLLVAPRGSFNVTVDDGASRRTFTLDNPRRALFVPPGLWRNLERFSEGSIGLALSSIPYSEPDYVREIDDFMKLTEHKRQ